MLSTRNQAEPAMNEPGLVTISMNELRRVKIIESVVEGRLSGVRAAGQLGLSERQVSRLRRRFEAAGAAGLVSAQTVSKRNFGYGFHQRECSQQLETVRLLQISNGKSNRSIVIPRAPLGCRYTPNLHRRGNGTEQSQASEKQRNPSSQVFHSVPRSDVQSCLAARAGRAAHPSRCLRRFFGRQHDRTVTSRRSFD